MKQMVSVRIGGLVVTVLLATFAVAAEWTVPVDFPTIQEAVDAAASGDTIRILAGDYDKQVIITNRSLTLVGEPGTVLHARHGMTKILQPFGFGAYPILAMVNSHVVLTGLSFNGEQLGNTYQDAFYGIMFVRGSGGRVENCMIHGFRGPVPAAARAINVVNGVGTVDLKIINSNFADNERSIALAGDENNPTVLRTTFTIEGNTFTGLGPTPHPLHNAIFIVTGAGGLIKSNTLSGYSYTGGINAFSSAIFAHDSRWATRGYVSLQPIRYEGNTFADNDHHLVTVTANGSQIVSNTFQGTSSGWRRWGALALSGTNVLVAHNEFSDVPIGIELFGGEANGTIIRGVAAGTKLFTNRFCRVHEPVRAQPLATGTQESGTEITCPVPPPRDLHVPADYATIQQAINAAASGDTIHIAAGDYCEQLVIANKGRLTLLGAPGATLHATTQMTETLAPFGDWFLYSVVGVFRSDLVLSNLTVDGEHLGETYTNSTLADISSALIGIYYLGSGGRVENCNVQGFRGPPSGPYTDANALYTDNSVRIGSPPIMLSVLNSTFSDNDRSIHLRGDPVHNPALLRTSFTVEGNTVSGLGAVAFAVDGILVRNGATGEVRNNTVRDHTYTGTGDAFSSGISALDGRANVRSNYVPLLRVRYEGNTFSNNDEHLVLIAANGSDIVNNVFHGRGPEPSRWGALALSGTNVLVANNDFSDLDTAILLFANDHYFTGWPPIPTAMNIDLSANWFCNVAEPLRVQSFITVFQEHARQLCPFRPAFQSINAHDGTLKVRAWHGQPITIEAADDLRNWTPIDTRTPALPTFDYREPTAPTLPQRFYRAAQ